MKDMKIQKAAAVCLLCGRPLVDVMRHPSILRWIAEQDRIEQPPGDPHAGTDQPEATPAAPPANGEPVPARIDICPDCWAKDHQLDYYCYWLARREPPREKQRKDRKGRNAFLRELFYHYYNNEHLPAGEVSMTESDDGADASGDVDDKEPAGEPAAEKSPEDLARERDLHLYLLAHLLMRYKVFQWKGAKTDRKKRRWLQFDDPVLGHTVKIADLDPADPALAAVHQELAELLAE